MALGFSAVAVLLAMASAAYACTIFEGSIQITGSTPAPAGFPTTGSGSSFAWGSGKNMTYCLGGNPTGYAYATATPVGSTGSAAAVTVAAHTCTQNGVTTTPRLGAGRYDVNFLNVGAFTNYSNRNWVSDCMSSSTSATSPPNAADTYRVGLMTVDANGSGTATVNLNATVPNATTSPSGLVPTEEAGICVSTPAGKGTPHGMQGPITIV